MTDVAVCLDCGLGPGTTLCCAIVASPDGAFAGQRCDRPLCDACAHPCNGGHMCHDHDAHYAEMLRRVGGPAPGEPEQGSLF